MRILIRPRLPILLLMVLTPGIPELLTGSTPISNLVFNPIGLVVGLILDIGLYTTGALLIREFAVIFRKGWGSILLLGAAYGIAEEGFEVHTFFQPGGSPVGVLASYGHAYGVNWLWALGLATFHACYSIALPLLLARLWFPEVRDARWFDRGALALVGAIFALNVVGFGLLVGHGPSPAALAFFVAVAAVLVALARAVPRDLLSVRPGPSRIGRLGIALTGTLLWDAWLFVLIVSGAHVGLSAWVVAAIFVGVNLVALAIVLTQVGTVDLERSEYAFATGMLVMLFLWDVIVEFSVPGILAVAAVYAYLLYRLGRRIARRTAPGPPPGAAQPAPPPVA